ncbi:MAG: three-Cys-motif partner protein TcmP, partial [Bacteroidales bacterium]
MNKFGGKWTNIKLNILETYTRQFLKVFKNKPFIKLLYFDGFAGSGEILIKDNEDRPIEGSVRRILSINEPRQFNMYYFVEKKKKYAKSLENLIKNEFPGREIYVTAEDCNKKLDDLSKFLKSEKGSDFKVLGFIDPKGMQLEW